MNLQTLNLVELDAQEILQIEGGTEGGGWGQFIVGQIIDHWGEIKQGLSDGWNGTYHP